MVNIKDGVFAKNLCGTCPPDEKTPCIKRRRPCHAVNNWSNGDRPLKEYLAGLDMDRYPNQDYKQALIEQQEAKALATKKTIEDAKAIDDIRRRLIAAALLADLTIEQVTQVLQISRQHVYRVARLEIRQYTRRQKH